MNSLSQLAYTTMPLDRASDQRNDEQWVEIQFNHPKARFVCIHKHLNLIQQSTSTASYLSHQQLDFVWELKPEIVFLGLLTDIPYFAVDIVSSNTLSLQSNAESFIDLRSVVTHLPVDDAAILAYARGMLYWHQQNQFCGRCGHHLHTTRGGHARHCETAGCDYIIFPRTDPAVIMLVEHIDDMGTRRCLLGHNSRFNKRMFSTLAGFVDVGESLEMAVTREVQEESGIVVNNVRYQASQPWPFPSAIMLGFRATAITTDITVDNDEILEAHWFSAEEIQKFAEFDTCEEKNCLPRKDSIARCLVDSWLHDVANNFF